jgi:glutamine amidotransferase
VIGIIDYGVGNLGSIVNMLKKIGVPAAVSGDPEVLAQADRLILPGVGAFDNGMKNLADRGLLPILRAKVIEQKTPILGLCLGMQLLARGSEEGELPGLGWIPADVVRFRVPVDQPVLRVPHMGWNYLQVCQREPLFARMEDEPRFYFVHSYHLVCDDQTSVLATTCYGYQFASAVRAGNIMGVQFHPEKSHRFGMQLLANFAEKA